MKNKKNLLHLILEVALVVLTIASFSKQAFAIAPLQSTFTADASALGATVKQMKVASDGTVYVLGTDTAKFVKVSADGSSAQNISYSQALTTNSGVDFVTDGTSFFISISVGASGQILRYDVSGTTATFVGSAGPFSGATSMSFAPSGQVYMTKAATVKLFGTDLSQVGITTNTTNAIGRSTWDGSGTFYYVSTAGTLRKIPTSSLSTDADVSSFGTNTDTSIVSNISSGAVGISVSPAGYIYVANTTTISKISPAGTTLWTKSITGTTLAMTVGSSGQIYYTNSTTSPTTTDIIRVLAPINSLSALSATPTTTTVDLNWTTGVSDSDFAGVTIRRSTSGYPTSPTDGTAVSSDNTNASFSDTGLSANTTYYYTVFNKTADGFYDAGTQVITTTDPMQNQAALTLDAVSTTVAYGGSTTLSTTGGSGAGAVSYAITAGGINCSVVGTTLIVTNIGSCTVTATKAADAIYNEATSNDLVITITKANSGLTADATPTTVAYGDTSTVSASSAGSGMISYSVTAGGSNCSLSGTTLTAISGVGTCTVTASQGADSSHNAATADVVITLTKANSGLTADATPTTVTYGATSTVSASSAGSGSVSYSVTAGVSNCSLSGTTLTAISGVGTCTVTASQAADSNYNAATADVVITVTKASQTTLTAQTVSTTIAYGDTTTVSTTGGSGTGAVSYSITAGSSHCSLSGTTLTAIGVGSCTVSASKAADANYNATTASDLIITVTKANQAALTAGATSSTINHLATTSLSTTGGSGSGAVSYSVTTGGSHCSITGSTLTGTGVGLCTVSATKATDASYNAATSSDITITVLNQTPTATSPSFSGTMKVGQVLTGSYTYSDADSDTESGSTFRWLRSATVGGSYSAIGSATSLTYTLTTTDVGQYIKFEVTPNDGTVAGSAVLSTAQQVGNTAPVASNVLFAGTTQVGQILTGSYSYSDADNDADSGTTFRWLRASTSGGSYSAIGGAISSTYTLTSADAHQFIKFEVTPNDGTTFGSAILSAAQQVGNSAPVASSVTFSGTMAIGQTLTGSHSYSDVDDDAESGSTFRWLKSSTLGGSYNAIGGATSSTYALTSTDAHQFIKFEVTPNDGTVAGTAVFSSAQQVANTAPVASSVSFSGTLQVGEILTGSYTYSDADGDSESGTTKRWLRSSTSGGSYSAISGANSSTYTLTNSDVHHFLKFEVTLNDGTAFGNIALSFSQEVSSTAPSAPTHVSAEVSGITVTLNWTNPSDFGFDSVTIRRSTTDFPIDSGSNDLVGEGITATSWQDPNLELGTYYYSLFAKNIFGDISEAAHVSIINEGITPTVTTDSASPIDNVSATFAGSLTDLGTSTPSVRGFEYGNTTDYGFNTEETGSFETGIFQVAISDLTCDTTYHYRAYATNETGTAYGNDLTFTTDSCPKASALTMTIEAPTTPVEINANATFVMSITNPGNTNIDDVSISFTLSENLEFVSVEKGEDPAALFTKSLTSLLCIGTSTITCELGTVTAGGSITLNITTKVKSVGALGLEATVAGDSGETNVTSVGTTSGTGTAVDHRSASGANSFGCQLNRIEVDPNEESRIPWVMSIFLIVLLAIKRFQKKASLLVLTFLFLLASNAHATTSRFSIVPQFAFQKGDWIATPSSVVLEKGNWSFSQVTSYSYHPLELSLSGARVSGVVDHLLVQQFSIGRGLTDQLTIEASFPLVWWNRFTDPKSGVTTNKARLGDLNIQARYRFFERDHDGFGLSVIPFFTIPTGSQSTFSGDALPTGGFRIVADKNLGSRVTAGMNIGMKFHEREVFYDFDSVSDLTMGTAVSVAIPHGLSAKGEITFTTALNDFYQNKTTSPSQVLLGMHKFFEERGIDVGTGVGLSLVRGAGMPLFHTFLGISYAGKSKPHADHAASEVLLTSKKNPRQWAIYFKRENANLSAESKSQLNQIASYYLSLHHPVHLQLQGDAYAKKTNRLTQPLFKKRISNTENYLVSRGITGDAFTITSGKLSSRESKLNFKKIVIEVQ